MFPQREHRKYYPNKTETFTHCSNLDLLKTTSDLETIGGKLKYFRKSKGLLQEDLANLANIHVCTIKRLENNYILPNLETCHKLASALNIPANLIYNEYLSFIDRDYSTFLKQLRKTLKLTQPQLANKLGVTKKTISSWERRASFPSQENYKLLMSLSQKGIH